MPMHEPTPTAAAVPGPAAGLHAESAGDGPTLLLAHGFTQMRRLWGGLDTGLAPGRRLVLVDLPGHGGSSAVRADLPSGARLLGLAGGTGDYLGYSMGARFCLHLALDRPDLVRRLVLISGTAGIDDEGERAERRRADQALADRLDPPGGGRPTDTVAEFVRRWVTGPIFGEVPEEALGVEERERNTAAGLASSLRLAGTGTQMPLWDRLGALGMPVLVLSGEHDAKFTALGRRMVRAIGENATSVVVPATDHAPHLQRPHAVTDAVRSFLAADTRS
jgi:2-succinyl-6-hydroxy-2,4-cyclohexadiene-1-carboxylate synthase